MTSSKSSRDLDYYFGIIWKILHSTTLKQIFIARAKLVQDLWREAPFDAQGLFNVKKPKLVRVKGWEAVLKLYMKAYEKYSRNTEITKRKSKK